MTGTVVYWNTEKRFGFIKTQEFQTDIYFNENGLIMKNDPIGRGLAVTFDVVSQPDGKLKARNVKSFPVI